MTKQLKIAVAGGDLRQIHLAGELAKEGFDVSALRLEKGARLYAGVHKARQADRLLPDCDVIVLPLPVTTDGERVNTPFSDEILPLDEILLYAKKDALLLGGMVGHDLKTRAEGCGLAIVDYLEREELAVKNAVSTSEGAVAIAMQERPSTIFGSTCLLTGFGRVSKVLAKVLTAMGARVVVAARRHSDLAWAQIQGCTPAPMEQLGEYAAQADIIFNTVPATILGKEILGELKKDCLLIDLASKPGGADRGFG